jgi:hypothetical protein
MDSGNLWGYKYFQLLFGDSTPPYAIHIIEGSPKQVMITSFIHVYSLVVVFLANPHLNFCSYMKALLDMDGSIYLDPHHNGGHLKHKTKPFIKLRYHQLRIRMITWTWDQGLWRSFLDYFRV